MAIKIPMGSLETSEPRTLPTGAPTMQFSDFAEYREFMAAFCAASAWWADHVDSKDAEPAIKFWFGGENRRLVFYRLMHEWFSGYWPTRQDLAASCHAITASSFGRILREAQDAKFIEICSDARDARTKVVKPTRQTISSFDKTGSQYFPWRRDCREQFDPGVAEQTRQPPINARGPEAERCRA